MASPSQLPLRLRRRGIKQATWNRLNPQERRELVRQSDQAALRTKRAGQPAATRKQQIRARARRFAAIPKPERGAFWKRYNKADEDEEFWRLYKGLV